MEPFIPQDEDVEDLFGRNMAIDTPFDSTQYQPFTGDNNNPIPIQQTTPPQLPHIKDQSPKPYAEQKQQQQPKNEFIDLGYGDDDIEHDIKQEPINVSQIIDLNLPIVDTLQPDELTISIHDTITKMSKLDPSKDAFIISAYKANLIEQLEKLQNISAAIDSLNNMQKTAENLPKNEVTGYLSISAINLALREHCFFAEQINVFGMILCDICDIKKLQETYSTEYTSLLLIKMCETIESEFIFQHLLFHYNAHRLVILVYISDENELMFAGKEIIRLLTTNSFEIKDQILHSSISCGAAIFEKDDSMDTENPFDFRTWLKNAELGLNKANNCGFKNQCAISKEDDVIRAIIPSMNDSSSQSNHKKQQKSTLSLLARSRGHSLANTSQGKLAPQINNQLTPQQIRASIRLYDKLSRLNINNKLIALSICRRMKDHGANYNFQHPKHNGNSILMLCCLNNLDVLIKYLCLKMYQEIDFNVVNHDGNSALMVAILNASVSDGIVKLITSKTTDKMITNHDGKTAVHLAQEMQRNELMPVLQGI